MIVSRYERVLLFLQDLLVLLISLWLTLIIRYQDLPTYFDLMSHLAPFSLLFVVWILVYYIAGLYEKQSSLWKKRLPMRLVRAQLINSAVAVGFFYLIPYFGISPKTFLFIYVVISGILLIVVRLFVLKFFVPRKKQSAVLIAGGVEKDELFNEINTNESYGIRFTSVIDVESVSHDDLVAKITEAMDGVTHVVIDLDHPQIQKAVGSIYAKLFAQVHIINFTKLYESLFDRIPLSSVSHGWFLEHISLQPRLAYTLLKRSADIFIATLGMIISSPLFLLAYILIKLDDGGSVLIHQKRIGQYNKQISISKFRTMTANDSGDYNSFTAKQNKITPVGFWLRKSRIDELPQLWSVIKGDQSLVGPRPELPALVAQYEKEISYYNVRHLIKPGLSGWAQVYGEHGHGIVAVEMTKNKLSYDLFYVKNRSIVMDLVIGLKTIATLFSFAGK